MRYILFAALAVAACEAPVPPATLADGTQINCEHVDADRSLIDALRIIANSTVNTTDPAEVMRLEQLAEDARARLADAEAHVAACDAAATASQ